MRFAKFFRCRIPCPDKRVNGGELVFLPTKRYTVAITPYGVFVKQLGGLAHILWHDTGDVIQLDMRTWFDSYMKLIHSAKADLHIFIGICDDTMTAIWGQVYWRVVDVPPHGPFLTDPWCVILLVVSWLWTIHMCKFFGNPDFPPNMPRMPLPVLRLLAPPSGGGVPGLVEWLRIFIDGEKTMKVKRMEMLPDVYAAFDLTQPMIDKCTAHVDRMMDDVEEDGDYELLTLPPLVLKDIARQLDIIRYLLVLLPYELYQASTLYADPMSLPPMDQPYVDAAIEEFDLWNAELRSYELEEMYTYDMFARQQGAGDFFRGRVKTRVRLGQQSPGGDDTLRRCRRGKVKRKKRKHSKKASGIMHNMA